MALIKPDPTNTYKESKRSLTITIPSERPISWNIFYSAKHWIYRSEEAQRVHSIVVASLPRDCEMFHERVDILITTYFKNRMLDSDNLCIKLYIDGLKGRLIENDTPKFVRTTSSRSELDKDNPRMEIKVTAV